MPELVSCQLVSIVVSFLFLAFPGIRRVGFLTSDDRTNVVTVVAILSGFALIAPSRGVISETDPPSVCRHSLVLAVSHLLW